MNVEFAKYIFAKGTLLFLWLFIFLSAEIQAQTSTDTDSIKFTNNLHEIEVTGYTPGAMRKLDSGAMQFNSAGVAIAGRILGESDYITAMKRLAGVSSIGDYASGITVNGASPSHSLFRIEGAPIFFPYRFGGIFSTFNTYFFNRAVFEQSFHLGAIPSRLGAVIDLSDSRPCPESIEGIANVGLLASSAAIRIPIGKRLTIAAAARLSYVNELYGSILNTDRQEISYRFHDFNISANWDIDSLNRIKFSGFLSKDRLSFDDSNYSMLMKLNWSNTMMTVGWEHSGTHPATVRIWHSGFDNTLGIGMSQFSVKSPARVKTTGGIGEITFRHNRRWETNAGIEINHYTTVPQWAEVKGTMPNMQGNRPHESDMNELRAFTDISIPLRDNMRLTAGLSASTFRHSDYHTTQLDPRATLTIRFNHKRQIKFHIGSYSQYLHQFGFSDIGLASDFWSGATKRTPAQKSWDFSTEYSDALPLTGWTISAMAYGKSVKSQAEFSGQLLDIVDASYDYQNNIIMSKGYNAGINLSVNGNIAVVNLNAAYSWGMARRHVSGSNDWWRSIFSPGHSLKLDADIPKGRWRFGASFSLASGRVYTPAKAIYIIANNVATIYGKRNSARMPIISSARPLGIIFIPVGVEKKIAAPHQYLINQCLRP